MSDKSITFPHTLRTRRLSIRPTRYGIVFILLLLGLFAGAVNYNNNLGFLLTFLLGSVVFVSITHTYKNILGIKILSCSTQPVFAGEQAGFEFVIDDSGIDRQGVAFALFRGKPLTPDFINGSKRRINLKVHASSRGVLRPWPLLIYSDYPLGLFRVQSQLQLEIECLVYPRPLTGEVKPIAIRSPADADGGLSGSGSDDFQGLRDYVPGDPLQRISWRASSRGLGLFTKDFEGRYGESVYLDWYSLIGPDTERKLSLLCAAVLKAQQLNLNYGLKLPGLVIDPGNGQIHKNRCLKTLALFSN